MKNNKFLNLKEQIKITIKEMENKALISQEKIIFDFLKKYNKALVAIDSNCESEIIKRLDALDTLFRAYLETSSEYEQDFLNEMSKVETIIRELNN